MTLTLKRFYYKRALLSLGVLFFVFSGLQAQQDYDYADSPQLDDDEALIVFKKRRYAFNAGLQMFYHSVDFEKRPYWNNYSKSIVAPVMLSADYILTDYMSFGLYFVQRSTAVSFTDSSQVPNEYTYYEAELGGRVNFHFLGLFMKKYSDDFTQRRFDVYLSLGYAGYMIFEAGTQSNNTVRVDAAFGFRPVGFIGARFAVAEFVGIYAEGIYGKMGHLGFGLTFGFNRK